MSTIDENDEVVAKITRNKINSLKVDIKSDISIESPQSYSNAELDAATEKLITLLPIHEQEWFRDIAKENNYPLWVVMLAQWRRCAEWGECAALLIDIDWEHRLNER